MHDDFPDFVTGILKKKKIDVNLRFLYHYTDGIALKSIIEKNEFWLTDRNYMNDILDEKYVKTLVKQKFGRNFDFRGSLLEEQLLGDRKQYVFSTSLEKDLIHQWAYYGNKDSYCIEFERAKLREYFWEHLLEDDDLYFGPIVYDSRLAKEIIDEVTDAVTSGLTTLVSNPVKRRENQSQLELKTEVYRYFYSLIKQRGHYCEKEFRFLVQTSRKADFRNKYNLLAPYIKVGRREDRLPISRIIIGPSNHDELGKRSIEKFLGENGYGGVKVSKSQLRVR